MAQIEGLTLTLTLQEVRAVHKALGKMMGKDYPNQGENLAGHAVYSELTPYVENE